MYEVFQKERKWYCFSLKFIFLYNINFNPSAGFFFFFPFSRFLKLYLLKILRGERQRKHEWGGREQENLKPVQSLPWGSVPGTPRSWPKLKPGLQCSDGPYHPGAPKIVCVCCCFFFFNSKELTANILNRVKENSNIRGVWKDTLHLERAGSILSSAFHPGILHADLDGSLNRVPGITFRSESSVLIHSVTRHFAELLLGAGRLRGGSVRKKTPPQLQVGKGEHCVLHAMLGEADL